MKTKKRIVLLIFVIGFLIHLVACGPGTLDWDYELPNGYRITRYNGSHINLAGNEVLYQNESRIGFQFIKEFAYNDRYLFTRQIDDIKTNDIFSEVYYIIDTKDDVIYGPYHNLKDIELFAIELKVSVPQRWYSTMGNPNEKEN
jgi:hypothetical protein